MTTTATATMAIKMANEFAGWSCREWGVGGLDTGHVKWPETKQKTGSSFCLSHLKQTGAGERSSSRRGPSPQTGPFCARSLALITFVENTRAISPLGFLSFLSFLSVAAWRCFSSQLAKLGQLQVAFSFLIVKQFANHMQFQLLLLLLLLLTDFCHTPNCRLLLFSPHPLRWPFGRCYSRISRVLHDH